MLNENRIEENRIEENRIEENIEEKNIKKEIYFENEEINDLFIEFLKIRKKIKAVNSDLAIKKLINKLNKYEDDIKIKMLENSIVNSWKDVYELKDILKKLGKKNIGELNVEEASKIISDKKSNEETEE